MTAPIDEVTDSQILHVARRVLGPVPLYIVRTAASIHLVATRDEIEQRWHVRFSEIHPGHLAFDRLPPSRWCPNLEPPSQKRFDDVTEDD